jgi:uncharacterized protein (TIGR04255 family)
VSNSRHLDRAPIHEALIDIQFIPVEGIDIGGIAAEFASGQSASVADLFLTMFELKVDKDVLPQAATVADAVGKRVDIPSKHQVLQFRNSGFTFSRLAPYETWEEMSSAALFAWEFFSSRLGAFHIDRVAVRYVNVLQLPLPIETFDLYLTSAPRVPNGLQQGISAFLTRIVCPQGNNVVIITQSLEGEINDGTALKVILDIDVSHECKLDSKDTTALKAVLDRLRACKNEAFFAYLTNEALEMYS